MNLIQGIVENENSKPSIEKRNHLKTGKMKPVVSMPAFVAM